MSNKFKVGDKVRCVRGTNSSRKLNEGGIYEVSTDQYGAYVGIVGIGSDWFASRFELVQAAQPTRPLQAGDKVRCIDNDGGAKVHITVDQEYEVERVIPGGFLVLKGVVGDYWAHRFNRVQPVPRDYRLMRNGCIASTGHKTPEEVAEYARKNSPDGMEFDIVEVVTVSKHTVRKVVEARA
ncbi:hypothetical protein G7968_07645 [Ralstonia solanacearum]|nr:hypothetical protein G7968_07645 [Ralstonia solanacearum]